MILRHALLLATAAACFGQRDPHVAYVYPAGGQRGTTFEVTVAGRSLAGPTNVYFSGNGITAKIIDYSRPLTPRELADAREQARKLQEKKALLSRRTGRRDPSSSTNSVVWTAEDEKLLGELRKKIANANRPRNPDTAEPVTAEVTIAPDAEPGQCELRLKTAAGLSNPVIFEVGELREFVEEAGAPDNRARYGRTSSNQPLSGANENEMNVAIPSVLNGQIMPGGVDRYRFSARQGARLHVSVHARALIPYLANAVPGWFQATLSLHDAKGRELAYADDNHFNPDPSLFFEAPANGDYVVAIKDSIYRGREDFIYRLIISESPSGRAEKPSCSEQFPEQPEREPNNSTAAPQQISVGVIINGRIDEPGDTDVFKFEATAGSQIAAEVDARHMNSPLDSLLRLTDASGRELARNDDFKDPSAGLVPHHTDSYLLATIPAKGVYFVHVADTQHKGGPDYAYRLRISPPRPDFSLRVVPSSINLRAGLSAPIEVYAIRKDGFTNEIALELKDAPTGFSLAGARVPANQDKIRLTITAPPSAREEPIDLNIEGSSGDMTHAAVPAENMMQAFAYHHLVPTRELKACVLGSRFRAPPLNLSPETLKIPKGGTATIQISRRARGNANRLQFELDDPPEGFSIDKVSESDAGLAITFRAHEKKVAFSTGNLIVNIFASRENGTNKTQTARLRAPVGCLPAIPFEVIDR